MGKGNTILRDKNGQNFNTYYIEYYEHDEEIDEETNEPYCNIENCHCNDTFSEDLIGNINTIKGLKKENYSFNDQHVIASNNILEIVIADNDCNCAIGCIPKLNDNNLYNEFIFKRSANRIMKEISNIYELTIRTSAWTSSKLNKEDKEFY